MPAIARCKCGFQFEANCVENNFVFHEGAKTFHIHDDRQIHELEVIAVPVNGPRQHSTAFHPTETTVVWQNPQTGHVMYPGKNDVPIPDRYVRNNYQRVELRSLRDVEKFEKSNGVRNERAWFDKGSGRSFDNDGAY